MPPTPLRILIADDHEVLRNGLRTLLSSPEREICGEAADGEEAIHKAVELRPDIVIIDLIMPKLNGIDAARQIHELVPSVKILALSSYDTRPIEGVLIRAGVGAALSKAASKEEILQAIAALVEQKPTIRSGS